MLHCAGNGSAEVAYRAQQLLEHSLLSELRAIVARALSGLDMFAGGQLSELDLLGSDFLETTSSEQASCTLYFLIALQGMMPRASTWLQADTKPDVGLELRETLLSCQPA